jgi:hypothetical protein
MAEETDDTGRVEETQESVDAAGGRGAETSGRLLAEYREDVASQDLAKVSRQIDLRNPTPSGDPYSIRRPKFGTPGYRKPDSLYMIYMRFDETGQLVVKQLQKLGGVAEGTVRGAEEALLTLARSRNGHIGVNFEGIEWRRQHYITFVIDNPGWTFFWGEDPRHEAIRFLRRKDGDGDLYTKENHTFFDAVTLDPKLGAGEAFRCINYFRNEFGDLSYGPAVVYCFEIVLQAPFLANSSVESRIRLIIDPDGQNQGPRT